jgi:tripartite-type tricarboxylate transporter receptor subunit TctC
MRTSKIRGYLVPVFLSLLMLLMRAASCQADSVEEFYRNKQVRFITAYSAGGLFDTATRIFGRHIGKFIPGKPNVWVDNMTGAGGLIATNYLANNAPRDGSVLLNLDGALLRLQALGNPAAKFDARIPSTGCVARAIFKSVSRKRAAGKHHRPLAARKN